MADPEDIFITSIEIKKLRHLEGLTIAISEADRRHLILTGANGSGKTSLLEAMDFALHGMNRKEKQYWDVQRRLKYESFTTELSIKSVGASLPSLYHFFLANRTVVMKPADGVKKLALEKAGGGRYAEQFLQFLVNAKAERSFARDDNDDETVRALDHWFERFVDLLGDLYGDPNLHLEFKRDTYDFIVHTKNREPFSLRTLSRGYNAILAIVAEIILRVENPKALAYETQGIVLIDEIETHLHIELQKRILPFLTGLFPRIQFIVTTHSPFVLTSIDDAVVFDLERQARVEDLWLYSSEALVEDYFQSDKYSALLKDRVAEYSALVEKTLRAPEEERRMAELMRMFANVSWHAAPELFAKLQELELDAIAHAQKS